MREVRYGTHKLYKGSNIIVFYDASDERIMYMFDNVRDILKFQNKEITRHNVNRINVEIYLALKRQGHFTRFLNKELLRMYIINLNEKEEGEE